MSTFTVLNFRLLAAVKKMITVGFIIITSGCSSYSNEREKNSGFLHDYADMQEVETASGNDVFLWVDPGFKSNNYNNIIFDPVMYYPPPAPSSQIGQQILDNILADTNKRLRQIAQKHYALITEVKPGTLRFRSAITAVNTSHQGLQFYEVIPIAMVVAGIQVATGHRTMDTHLYLEGELVDVTTNKTVVKFVRKQKGRPLKNEDQKLTAEDVNVIFDEIAADTEQFIKAYP